MFILCGCVVGDSQTLLLLACACIYWCLDGTVLSVKSSVMSVVAWFFECVFSFGFSLGLLGMTAKIKSFFLYSTLD